MKTLAAVLERLNAPLEIRELTIPSLKLGQVLVEIAYSGLCHSQLNEIKGLKGPDPYLPHTLGHEGSGVILEIGEGVTKVKPGDHVVLSWIKGTGLDVPASAYECAGQKVNSGAISTFLQRAVISENRVIPIPKTLPLKEAALLGCAIPTGAGVVFNQMQLTPGASLAIFGAGGLGLSALLAARALGAEKIIVIDVHEEKLEKAKQFGATCGINALKEDPLQQILQHTSGRGVDFAFECAGRKEVMEIAFSAVKAPDGLCVLSGNLPKGQQIQIDPFDLIRGKKIVGTWGGSSNIDHDVQRYCKLFLSQSSQLGELITHESELTQINELFLQLEKGKVGRALIAF